jgi:hypothetical protein
VLGVESARDAGERAVHVRSAHLRANAVRAAQLRHALLVGALPQHGHLLGALAKRAVFQRSRQRRVRSRVCFHPLTRACWSAWQCAQISL